MRKLTILLALGALAPVGLVACGGGDNGGTTSAPTAPTTSTAGGGGGGGGGGETVAVAADPSGAFKFQQTSLTAKAGTDTFDFTNDSAITHDFCIEGASPECSATVAGGEAKLVVTLDPGTYTYFCSVDGHRDAGMEGTLTVK